MTNITSQNGRMRLMTAPATNRQALAWFMPGYAAALTEQPEMLYAWTRRELADSSAIIGLVVDTTTGCAVSGARAVRDGSGIAWIGQAWTSKEHRGNGFVGAVICGLRLHDLTNPPLDKAPSEITRLDVRVINGAPAASAARAYARIGFEQVGLKRLPIPDDRSCRHLKASADPDGYYTTSIWQADDRSLSLCGAVLRQFADERT